MRIIAFFKVTFRSRSFTSSEILVGVVDVVLDGSGLDEKFLGITLFALVPNTTEFMNAISFALNDNITLRHVSECPFVREPVLLTISQ